MKKLLALIFVVSAGAIIFAAETAPTTGTAPQANPENRQRPFFTDDNKDGICDNYRDFHRPRARDFPTRPSGDNRKGCNPRAERNHHGISPSGRFGKFPGRNCPDRNNHPAHCYEQDRCKSGCWRHRTC